MANRETLKNRRGMRLISGSGEEPPKDEEKKKARNSTLRLLKAIEDKVVDVSTLTAKDRRMCVAELLRQGYRQIEIADIFDVSYQTITNDKKWMLRQLGLAVKSFNPQQFIGWLLEEAEFHMARAKHAKNYGLSWSIASDLAKILMSFGMRGVGRGEAPALLPGESADGHDPMEECTAEELRQIETILLKRRVHMGGGHTVDVTPENNGGETDDSETT